ncbi:phosphonoacetaldehyde reductase [Bacilliculturomica massiliensis]|uniref:phosphonoacetaldehyde reductase n=1 Tax=Bacilliculturomica massiliensis TaxID=1917867 RepID=UPI001030B134|nr:phosphonoacetaldehyde reductase [Bacilliculturomica massiliensis]
MYNPFCSVEIEFSNMQGLHDLINTGGDKKTLIVCDVFTTDIWGITDEIKAGVAAGHLAWVDKCPGNPTQQDVYNALMAVKELDPVQIIAIGGGSTIDLAKAVSAFHHLFKDEEITIPLITRALKEKSYTAPHPFIDIIAVPSAAGTGSEVTQFATIWDVDKVSKFSIDTKENYAKKAVVIPELTLSLPLRLTLSTGLDALSHAVESFWAKPTNYLVKDIALRAIDMIMTYLPQVLADPKNLELRTAMSRAALLAGMAFAKTRTTACHSISYPITMQYGLEHGLACALSLDAVSKINREKTALADMLFEVFEKHGGMRNWLDATCEGIVELRLSYFGIPKEGIDGIVEGTFTKGRMDNNPVDIKPEQVKEILLSVY